MRFCDNPFLVFFFNPCRKTDKIPIVFICNYDDFMIPGIFLNRCHALLYNLRCIFQSLPPANPYAILIIFVLFRNVECSNTFGSYLCKHLCKISIHSLMLLHQMLFYPRIFYMSIMNHNLNIHLTSKRCKCTFNSHDFCNLYRRSKFFFYTM